MKTPFTIGKNGQKEWQHQPGDQYLVLGTDTSGRKFSTKSQTWFYARAINLWEGSKWLVRDGKRHLIERISN